MSSVESAPPSVPKVLFDGIPNLVSHWSQAVRVIKFLLENGMSWGELGEECMVEELVLAE